MPKLSEGYALPLMWLTDRMEKVIARILGYEGSETMPLQEELKAVQLHTKNQEENVMGIYTLSLRGVEYAKSDAGDPVLEEEFELLGNLAAEYHELAVSNRLEKDRQEAISLSREISFQWQKLEGASAEWRDVVWNHEKHQRGMLKHIENRRLLYREKIQKMESELQAIAERTPREYREKWSAEYGR